MAQIPRNLPPIVPSNVTSGRLQGGPRSVASGSTQIEETNAQEGVLFNDALLFEGDQATERKRRDNAKGHQLVEHADSTQTFAAIFEEGNVTGTGSNGDAGNNRARGFANMIARAISTYETNDQIIHGVVDKRGATLSLSL